MKILEKKIPEQKRKLELLMQKLQYMNRVHRSTVKKAYLLAEDAHKFQKRLSGEAYIIHPFNVALILADLTLDYETICAGLLHDVLEDTAIDESYIRKEFGDSTAALVKAVTNISVIKNQSKVKVEAENMRRIILETVKDPRVILVKLADKLHNMRTLEFQPAKKSRKIAREALDIYAPLAGRLGIYKIKSEIEDISLSYLREKQFDKIRKMVSEKKSTRDRRVKAIASILAQSMKEQKIKCAIEGRSKHFYSIYLKMMAKNKNYGEIYDLTGLRVLVDTVQDCYKTLGVIHNLWSPLPGRFKDYISVPKSNGYQSLHTTVIGNGGKHIEFQIRTKFMHTVSEIGIAAHWTYKGKKENYFSGFENIFQNITDLNADRQNPIGFIRDLKDTLVDDEIYAFTPKGEIITLPAGSTVLDFAFQIHTDLGLHCAGAEIDSKYVSIRTPVKNGNQIKVISNPSITPTKNWAHIVKSSHAKSKLRNWFKRHPGSDVRRIDYKTAGNRINGQYLDEMVLIRNPVKLNYHGLIFVRAECCNPLPDDDIRGAFGSNNQLVVHSKNCPHLPDQKNINDKNLRTIDIAWNETGGPLIWELSVSFRDEPEILLELTRIILLTGSHVFFLRMDSLSENVPDHFPGQMNAVVQLQCDNIKVLRNTIQLLKRLDSVEKLHYKVQQFGERPHLT